MSNDSTSKQPERLTTAEPAAPPAPPAPRLPQFDPTSAGPRDETQVLPSTPTAQTPIVPPTTRYTYAGGPAAPAAALERKRRGS